MCRSGAGIVKEVHPQESSILTSSITISPSKQTRTAANTESQPNQEGRGHTKHKGAQPHQDQRTEQRSKRPNHEQLYQIPTKTVGGDTSGRSKATNCRSPPHPAP